MTCSFSRSAHPVRVDGAFLNHIKTFGAITFAKEIFTLIEMFRNDEGGDGLDVSRW
jgi:hypothetical protein